MKAGLIFSTRVISMTQTRYVVDDNSILFCKSSSWRANLLDVHAQGAFEFRSKVLGREHQGSSKVGGYQLEAKLGLTRP